MEHIHRFVSAVAAFVPASLAAAQPCEPDWLPTFGGSAVGGPVRAVVAFDLDGPGPEPRSLIAIVRGILASPITRPVWRWTGGDWEPVGGVELQRLATTSSGDGGRGALAIFDADGPGPIAPALYAAGEVRVSRDGVDSFAIARFDGAAWNHVGSVMTTLFSSASARVYDLEIFDEDGPGPLLPALFAAGENLPVGDPDAGNIARWDGSAWTAVGAPLKFGAIRDLATWDPDGGGPALPVLCAAGSFNNSLDMPPGPSYLAAWDGTNWTTIGEGAGRPGHGLGVAAFDLDADGPEPESLIVAGGANEVDPGPGSISAWDGASWKHIMDLSWTSGDPVASGRMTVHDDDGAGPNPPALYIGAAPAGAQMWRAVSRWDGTDLTPLGGEDITSPGNEFGGAQRRLSLAPATTMMVDAFHSFDLDGDGPMPPSLVIGGGFSAVAQPPSTSCSESGNPYLTEEVSASFIATWNGTRWGALGRGVGVAFPLIASATAITPLDTDAAGPSPESLFVAGMFNTAGPIPIPLRTCQDVGSLDNTATQRANARWDAAEGWRRAGLDPDIDPRLTPRHILAATDFDPDGDGPAAPTKHIAGSFDRIEGAVLGGGPVARWNPGGSGLQSDSSLGAGGWESIADLVGGATVHALTTFDPDGGGPSADLLIAGGDFDAIGHGMSSASGAVAAWDGSQWTSLGFADAAAVVTELIVFDSDDDGPLAPRLIAAGDFVHNTASGQARDIAQYDASGGWSPLGAGNFTGQATTTLPVQIMALAIFDDDGAGPLPPALYAGGNFFQWTDGVTPIAARGIARWDGSQWAALPLNLANPSGCSITIASPLIYDFIVFDADGPKGPMGDALFAAGAFDVPGISPASRGVGRWDGSQWSPLGNGLSFDPFTVCGLAPTAFDLAVFDDDGPTSARGMTGAAAPALFIAGSFLEAGADSAWSLAKWGCPTWESAPPPLCPGDANADGQVSFADITSVLENFGFTYPGPPGTTGPGDANHDGVVNFDDITDVLTFFGLPCP